METKYIRELLDKYYEGNTSLDEERILALFFHSDNVPREFEKEKTMFRYYYEAKNEMVLDESFSRLIDDALESVKSSRVEMRRRIVSWRIAAILLILISIGSTIWIFHDNIFPGKGNPVLADTYSDPQKAFEETRRALLMVSSKLNQGKAQLNHLSRFNQGMQQLNSVGFYLVTDFKAKENEKQ